MFESRFNRRDFLLLAGAAGGAAVLAACRPPAAPEPVVEEPAEEEPAEEEPAEAPPPEKKVITVWFATSDTHICLNETAVGGFNETSETGFAEGSQKADLPQIIYAALAAGAGPDAFPTHGPSYVVEPAEAGTILNLDAFIDQYGWADRFAPWSLDVGRIKGKLFSLACQVETIVLWYNEILFGEKGWEPPTTTDEMVALCEKIEADDIIPFAGQAGECQECNEWYFIEFANKVAGPDKFYKALIGELPWTDPGFEEGMVLLADMLQKGYWMGALDNFLAATFDEFRSAFGNGTAAMNMEGTWFYGAVGDYFTEDNPYDWAIAPFPSKTGDPIYSIGLGGSWCGNAAAEHPDVVGEFLNYFFLPEIQGKLFNVCRYAPAAVGVTPAQMPDVDPRMSNALDDMNEAFAAGNYGYTTWTFFPPKSLAYVYENIELVWLGETTAMQYLEGLDAIFQEELIEGVVPPIPER